MTDRIALRIALDAQSVRRYDQDGHLHISRAVISTAVVSGYLGREIPDYGQMGLEPTRVYQLLRDPQELAKAAPTFANKPLLFEHKPVTAQSHDPDITVGSVANPQWISPNLVAELVIWDGEAIAAVEDREKSDLSAGYRYKCVMEPGQFQGVPFDGRMVDIVGNHVALVEEGRVPGAFVGDSADEINKELRTMARAVALSGKALLVSGALRAHLAPKLAKDKRLPDMRPILSDVTEANWAAAKPRIVARLGAAIPAGTFAMDGALGTVGQLLEQLDTVTGTGEEAQPMDPDDDGAMDGDDDAELMAKIQAILGPDADPAKCKALCDLMRPPAVSPDPDGTSATDPAPGEDGLPVAPPAPAMGKMPPKAAGMDDDLPPGDPRKKVMGAMDAKIAAAVKTAEDRTIARIRSVETARREVAPWVGDLHIALDSAADVYKAALKELDVNVGGVTDVEALKLVLSAQPRAGATRPPGQGGMGMDAAASKTYASRFPAANRLKSH